MRVRRLPRGEEAMLVEHVEEFLVHDRILDVLSRPLPPAHRHLTTLGAGEPLSVSLSVSTEAGA